MAAVTGLILAAALDTQFNTPNSPQTLYRLFALGAIATVVLWVWWFITRPKEKAMDGQDSQEQKDVKGDAAQTSGETSPTIQGNDNVVSINQSGGITARQVHIGAQQRTLGGVPVAMVERLKAFAGTKFDSQNANDAESTRYESEILQFLAAAGWVLEGRGFSITFPATVGLWVYAPEDQRPAAEELIRCLRELGLQAGATTRRTGLPPHRIRPEDPAPEPKIQVTVGLRP